MAEYISLSKYVFSFSVCGGTDAFKSYVLDHEGYVGADGKPVSENAEFKIKSRRIARDINVTMTSGRKAKKTAHGGEKQFPGLATNSTWW